MNVRCLGEIESLSAGFLNRRNPGGIWIRDRRDDSCVRVGLGSADSGNIGGLVRGYRINEYTDLLVETDGRPLSRGAVEELTDLIPRIRRTLDEN